MLQSFKDHMHRIWEGRFRHGINYSLLDGNVGRYDNGSIQVVCHVGTLVSLGTGHWPWYVFEMGWLNGSRPSWHLGILGFTVGMTIVNDYDNETQEIVGPDKKKYYWFFKCINHQHKQFEEVI